MSRRILGRGAEAIIEKTDGRVVKKRIKKSYRIKELDEELRKKRIRIEARIMEKLYKNNVNVPKIIGIDNYEIIMEYIKGERLVDIACENKELIEQFGILVGKMHSLGIYHGDLTTSNALVKDGKVFLIDFGLAGHSLKIEDYAVDLHVLRQALESRHYKCMDELWELFLKGYRKEFKKAREVLERLKIVESRGRYKGRKK